MSDAKTKQWHKKDESTKNFVLEKVVFCMSGLKIEEGKIYDVCQVGKQIKMSYYMFQHLTRVSKLPLMDFMRLMQRVVIEGKVDGKARGPTKIEQPTMVQKKKLNKISDYGIILSIGVSSHISGIFSLKMQNPWKDAKNSPLYKLNQSRTH